MATLNFTEKEFDLFFTECFCFQSFSDDYINQKESNKHLSDLNQEVRYRVHINWNQLQLLTSLASDNFSISFTVSGGLDFLLLHTILMQEFKEISWLTKIDPKLKSLCTLVVLLAANLQL